MMWLRLQRYILCALLGHPPFTSTWFDGRYENAMERTTNILAAKGSTIQVSCACGRKRVHPIWRPWWRKD